MERPNDRRGFLHKKILGLVGTVAGVASTFGVPGAGLVSTLAGRLRGPRTRRARTTLRTSPRSPRRSRTVLPEAIDGDRFGEPARPVVSVGGGGRRLRPTVVKRLPPPVRVPVITRRPPPVSIPVPRALHPEAELPQSIPQRPFPIPGFCPPGTPGCKPLPIQRETMPHPQPCPRGTVPDPQGRGFCIDPQSPLGASTFGEAQMGSFGAGLVPAAESRVTRSCPRGSVLGNDGLCYNKRDLRNSDRMWPRGTRPLLTGGEMRCIRIAASAARKLKTKEKQLQKMGMLQKPARRRALPAGHSARLAHD